MARPFDYRRMTPAEFRDALQRTGLTQNTFSKLTGMPNRTVGCCMSGLKDNKPFEIPQWVPTFLALVEDRDTMQRAWDHAKTRIIEIEERSIPLVGEISDGGRVRMFDRKSERS
ncbi:hypothetical protein [Terrarubrum flagellatum]|uniref:hypothetical protein n=1 Tax=Terrirubrum flagellatum TaxID=2895980 RepID=UPI003144E913